MRPQAPVSVTDNPAEAEEGGTNRYGARLSVLSSRLDQLHCKYGQEKKRRQTKSGSISMVFCHATGNHGNSGEGGSRSRGDAMGIFLSTIPGCEINTQIKFHSLLPTVHGSAGSPIVACKQTQTRTGRGARTAEFEALRLFWPLRENGAEITHARSRAHIAN